VDETGRVVRSFGSRTAIYRPDAPYLIQRALHAIPGTGVWIAHRTQYVLEFWHDTHDLDAVLVRDADWFRPYLERANNAGPDDPPRPYLRDVYVRGDTAVTLISVASREFGQLLEPRDTTPEGMVVWDYDPCERLFDTVIEHIDILRGTLLHTTRVNECLERFLPDGRVVGRREVAGGVPVLDIWSLHLHALRQE
jgi:hypothetical protein